MKPYTASDYILHHSVEFVDAIAFKCAVDNVLKDLNFYQFDNKHQIAFYRKVQKKLECMLQKPKKMMV